MFQFTNELFKWSMSYDPHLWSHLIEPHHERVSFIKSAFFHLMFCRNCFVIKSYVFGSILSHGVDLIDDPNTAGSCFNLSFYILAFLLNTLLASSVTLFEHRIGSLASVRLFCVTTSPLSFCEGWLIVWFIQYPLHRLLWTFPFGTDVRDTSDYFDAQTEWLSLVMSIYYKRATVEGDAVFWILDNSSCAFAH